LASTAFGIGLDYIPLFGLAAYYFKHASHFIDSLHAPLDIGFMYFGASHHAYLTGDEQACLEWASLSANAFKDAGDAHRWAVAVLRQAYVYLHRCKTKQVRQLATELQHTGEEMQDLSISCIAEALFGFDTRLRGDLPLAIKHFQRATKFAADVPDYTSLAGYLSELARCHLRLGDWEESIKIITAAEHIANEHNIKGVSLGYYYNCRAEIYLYATEKGTNSMREKFLDTAQKAVSDTIQGCKRLHPSLPDTLRLQARLEWLMGKKKNAKKYWLQSIEQAKASGHSLDEAISLLEIGLRTEDHAWSTQGVEKFATINAAGEEAFLLSLCKTKNSKIVY